MYITTDEVNALTAGVGATITLQQVQVAQFIIEVYTGRTESEVSGARDKELLARAVAAQAIYMAAAGSWDVTFSQVAATSVQRGDGMTVFDVTKDSPFIAPLAVMACKHVSWKKSHSVTIGKTFGVAERARALYWMSVWGTLSSYGTESYGLDGTSPSDYATIPFNQETWDEV
jgi:hypothetical protein